MCGNGEEEKGMLERREYFLIAPCCLRGQPRKKPQTTINLF
jgi:hypothetical protein